MGTIWHVSLQTKTNLYDLIVVEAKDGIHATEKAKELIRQRYATINIEPEFLSDSAWVEPNINGAVLLKVG